MTHKPKRTRPYAFTPHDVAMAAMKKGWKPFKTRADFESSLRSKDLPSMPAKEK